MGTVKVNVLPSPGTLVTSNSPLSRTAILREMARPRPVPPEFPGGGLIALGKRLKEPRKSLCGDADAGIDDFKPDGRLVVPLGEPGSYDPHAAFFRELDRVADEVNQCLPQPAFVSQDGLGNPRSALDGQREASLLGAVPQEAGHVGQQRHYVGAAAG